MDLATASTFARAFTRALMDSTKTDELLVGEEISSIGRMSKLLPMMVDSEEGRRILAERPIISSETVDFDALRRLPAGTLGRVFVEHLEREGLDPDALAVPVTRGDEVSNYLLQRIRQTHDIWHTLLGLGAAGHEEVLVHTFQWPQLRMPYSALVVVFGTLKHIFGEARWRVLRRGLLGAYLAGRQATPLLPVYWEHHWDVPVEALRLRLKVQPVASWAMT